MTRAEFVAKMTAIVDSDDASIASINAAKRQLQGLKGRYCMAQFPGVRVGVRIGENPMNAIDRKLGSSYLHQDSYDMNSYRQFDDGSTEASTAWFVIVSSKGSVSSRMGTIDCPLKHNETLGEYFTHDGYRLQITE